MLLDAGLLLSVALGAWLCLDVAMAEIWRRRSLSIALLGGFSALWAGSELLIGNATSPTEFAVLRRFLYLGISGSTFCWYWVAVEADAPRWFRAARWRVTLPCIPLVFSYLCVLFGPDMLIISFYTEKPAHGPLYVVPMATSYTLIGLGLVHYARAAVRVGRTSHWRLAALTLALGVPFVFNVMYNAGTIATDVSPAMLGLAAIMIRIAVVDPGLGVYLPLARGDVIEQLSVGVVVTDIEGRVIDANEAARRFIGVGDPLGCEAAALLEDLDPCIEVSHLPLHSHLAITGRAIVLTDRADALRAEQRLQLAARLEALGSLTAGIAHEINNPLAYVRANLNVVDGLLCDLARPGSPLVNDAAWRNRVDDGLEGLVDAADGVERIALLIARLKGFAREPDAQQCFEYEAIDLAEVVAKAIDVAGIGLPPGAIVQGGVTSLLARSAEPALVQILVNLLLNAIQASEEAPQLEVMLHERGEKEVEIAVSDRGPGLDPDSLDRVFDPFYTTKPTGSGLGLSISYDLAVRLEGRIEVHNREGGGATFSLILPREMHA